MDDNNICYDYITRYLTELIKLKDSPLIDIEQYAIKNYIPIITPEVSQLLQLLGLIIKPEHILEIGTAIGYSAIILAGTLLKNGSLTTIEKDAGLAEIARENINKAGFTDKITVINGDALQILPNLPSSCSSDGMYNLIFMDAAKGQYLEFFPYCYNLLKKGGVLICDNVLYKGMTATDELLMRRKITIVKRLRKYLNLLSTHEGLHTSIIPIGDGVSVSFKK